MKSTKAVTLSAASRRRSAIYTIHQWCQFLKYFLHLSSRALAGESSRRSLARGNRGFRARNEKRGGRSLEVLSTRYKAAMGYRLGRSRLMIPLATVFAGILQHSHSTGFCSGAALRAARIIFPPPSTALLNIIPRAAFWPYLRPIAVAPYNSAILVKQFTRVRVDQRGLSGSLRSKNHHKVPPKCRERDRLLRWSQVYNPIAARLLSYSTVVYHGKFTFFFQLLRCGIDK